MNTITLFFIFIPILVVILLVANLLLAVHRPDSEKVTSYECGYNAIYGQTRERFSISFFLVGILFTVFDLEILIVFPYASCMYTVQSYGFWIVMIFFIVLTVGFVYEFGSKALYFTNGRTSINVVNKTNKVSPFSNSQNSYNSNNMGNNDKYAKPSTKRYYSTLAKSSSHI